MTRLLATVFRSKERAAKIGRVFAACLFLLPAVALGTPEPAAAQLEGVGAFAGGLLRGLAGGGHYYHRRGGHSGYRHYARHNTSHHRVRVASRGSHHRGSGGVRHASGGAPSGPGAGSFH